jgi:caudovirus prohead protease
MIVQVLSNESVNDRGYVVMNNSIDWGRYRKNPVLMLQHFQWDNPIGSVRDIKLNAQKKRWEGILVFASTKEGQKYKQMYEEGSYNAVSIAGKVEFAERKGKKFTTKFEVYEISLVAIPSNEDAVAIREKNAKLGCLPVEFCITESQQVEQLSADFETEINNYLSMEEKEEKLEKAPEMEEIQQEVQEKENLSSGLSGILSRFEEKLSSLLGKKEEGQNPVKEEKLESEEDEKEKLSSEIEKEPEQEKLTINPEEKTLSFDKSNQIMANYTSLNDYLSDKSKASKVVRMARLSAKATDSELLSVQDDLKEISAVMLNDEKLMSALGQIRISNPKRGEMSLNEMLTAIVNDHEMLQARGKTYQFMGDPDLAVVNWIGLFFRLLFPVNTFADRIPRISSTQTGTIHVQSKYDPAVYYGNNVPASQAAPYSYDDAAIAIPTRVFSLQPTLFQQANDDMLNYDKRGWGMAEALRVISNAAHNYYLQTIATAAADNKVTMSGTEYFASAGMFPANTKAAGEIKKITVADILTLSSLFRNQNFNFDYEYPELILDSVYYNQLIADSSFVNLLNRPTESIRPMGTTAYNFEIHARSITSLWNTATSAIVDPKLYGIPLESNGNIPSSYPPPLLADTAYGLGIGFFPSQVIIGIGNTHVHMVQDPTRYGWMFSMDFRTGCGAAREGGVGTGLIVPAAKG